MGCVPDYSELKIYSNVHSPNKLINYRKSTSTDLGFIYSSWLQGLYYGNDWFRQIDQEKYFDFYHQVVEKILFNPGTLVTVACLNEDQDVILGYSVVRKNILDWVFVLPAWRKLGIATHLIPKEINTVTHLTKVGKSLKPKEWKFDPFLI